LVRKQVFINIVVDAIIALKERKGSSRPAIKKYILANYKVSAGSHFDSQIAAAIKRGQAKNLFNLPKGNYHHLYRYTKKKSGLELCIYLN